MTHARYCKDCKHRWQSSTGLVPDICKSPKLPVDLVTGEPIFTTCKDQRYPTESQLHFDIRRTSSSFCKQEGNWFESKEIEDADLDDLSTIPFGKQP